MEILTQKHFVTRFGFYIIDFLQVFSFSVYKLGSGEVQAIHES